MTSCLQTHRSRFDPGPLGLITASVAVLVFAGSAAATPQDYRVPETINQHGDISGWNFYSGAMSDGAIPFVIISGLSGEKYVELPMEGENGFSLRGGPAARALASARAADGSHLICGYSYRPDGDSQLARYPALWHLQCDEATIILGNENENEKDYAGGFFTDVAWDDAEDRWIVVGRVQNLGTGDALAVGATTVTVGYGSDDGPIPNSLATYGPVPNPKTEIVRSGCKYYIGNVCNTAEDSIQGSTDLAWSITMTDSPNVFYSSGNSSTLGYDDDAPDENNDTDPALSTSQLAFVDTLEGNDLLMPVTDDFLVKPDNWLCAGELANECWTDDDDKKQNSIEELHAFDVLANRQACGVLLEFQGDPSSTQPRWQPFHVLPGGDTAQDLPTLQPNFIKGAAFGGTIREPNDDGIGVHLVGFEQIANSFSTYPNVTRSIDNVGTLTLEHRAVEWVDGVVQNINASQIPSDVILLSASDINENGAIIGLAVERGTDNEPLPLGSDVFGYLLTETGWVDLDSLRQSEPCPGDFNCDGIVNGADFGFLLAAWGTSNEDADLNGDGVVSGADLGALLAMWGPCS